MSEIKRGDIEDEWEGMKKVQLTGVRENEVTAEIGTHRDMGVRTRYVEGGEKSRRRKETGKGHVIVETEGRGKDELIQVVKSMMRRGGRPSGRGTANRVVWAQEQRHPS